jgi:hypothetical protein
MPGGRSLRQPTVCQCKPEQLIPERLISERFGHVKAVGAHRAGANTLDYECHRCPSQQMHLAPTLYPKATLRRFGRGSFWGVYGRRLEQLVDCALIHSGEKQGAQWFFELPIRRAETARLCPCCCPFLSDGSGPLVLTTAIGRLRACGRSRIAERQGGGRRAAGGINRIVEAKD